MNQISMKINFKIIKMPKNANKQIIIHKRNFLIYVSKFYKRWLKERTAWVKSVSRNQLIKKRLFKKRNGFKQEMKL